MLRQLIAPPSGLRLGPRLVSTASRRNFSKWIRPSCPLHLSEEAKPDDGPDADSDMEVSVAFKSSHKTPICWFPTDILDKLLPQLSKLSDNDEPVIPQSLFTQIKVNPQFWPQAQQVLASHIHQCPTFDMLAKAETKTTFFHIYDLRRPPPSGRIPEVEDILGTVRVKDGNIVANSFEPNNMYRPVTPFGLMWLSPEMAAALANSLP